VVRRVVAALALGALLIACTGGSSGPSAPVDASFTRFDGSGGTLAQYRGKPVVVNFFSSTCVPCQAEMPALEQVHRQVGDDITFLGLDVQDTVEGGKAFVDTVGITWELGRDPDASILQGVMHGTALPTTVILDSEGRIVFSHLGKLDQPEELTKVLQEHHLVP
jgi:thiol-disulfide isomerase/thioredoxin